MTRIAFKNTLVRPVPDCQVITLSPIYKQAAFQTRKSSDHTHTHILKMASSRVVINYSVVLLGLILLSGSICKADESSESVIEHVLTLDHSNLTQTVAKHDFIVVEFYAPW